MNRPGGQANPLSKPAIPVHNASLGALRTAVVGAATARITLCAANTHLSDDALTFDEAFNARAQRGDLADPFMPQRDRIVRESRCVIGHIAVDDFQVSTADSYGLHTDYGFTFVHFWLRNVFYDHFVRCFHLDRSHSLRPFHMI